VGLPSDICSSGTCRGTFRGRLFEWDLPRAPHVAEVSGGHYAPLAPGVTRTRLVTLWLRCKFGRGGKHPQRRSNRGPQRTSKPRASTKFAALRHANFSLPMFSWGPLPLVSLSLTWCITWLGLRSWTIAGHQVGCPMMQPESGNCHIRAPSQGHRRGSPRGCARDGDPSLRFSPRARLAQRVATATPAARSSRSRHGGCCRPRTSPVWWCYR
jgi:hypothetical protein